MRDVAQQMIRLVDQRMGLPIDAGVGGRPIGAGKGAEHAVERPVFLVHNDDMLDRVTGRARRAGLVLGLTHGCRTGQRIASAYAGQQR